MEQEFELDGDTFSADIAIRPDRKVVAIRDADGHPAFEEHIFIDGSTRMGIRKRWGSAEDKFHVDAAIEHFRQLARGL